MLIATVGLTSRTERALGRGRWVAMIHNLNEDGSKSYAAHRYAERRKDAVSQAECFGAIVYRPRKEG